MGDADRTIDECELEPGIAGSQVVAVALFALAEGISPSELESATGLAMSGLIDPDLRQPAETLPQVWQCLLRACPGQALPLKLAQATPYDFFGPLAHVSRFAVNLHEALDCFVRYRRVLTHQLECGLIVDGERAIFYGRHPLDNAEAGASAQLGLALAARYLREDLKMPEALLEVHFAQAAIGPLAAYEAFFDVPVLEGQAHNGLVFRTHALDQELAQADRALFRYIEAKLEAAAQRLRVPDELAKLRSVVASNATRGDFRAESVASGMGLSLRVLQRKLSDHGLSLKSLLEQSRDAQACELLADRRLSVEEIAFILGYADERSFRRAFKSRLQKTPAQFRREQTVGV